MCALLRKSRADSVTRVAEPTNVHGTQPALSNAVPTRIELHAAPAAAAEFLVSHVACTHRSHASHAPSAACRYRVAWSINPHMRIGASTFSRAQKQHDDFVSALRGENAHVQMLNFVHGAYDSVFAKDTAVLAAHDGHRRALLATPLHAERKREQGARARGLERLGFAIERCDAPLEGGDVVALPALRGAFLGYGVRSSREAAPTLARFLDAPVTPLELVDPHLFHLDVALAVLADGTALACDSAFTRDGARCLREHPAVTRVVSVPDAEARAFGLNLVQVGDAVVMGSRAPTVEQAIADSGFRVVHSPLSEFQLAGGSAACLVARVHSHEQMSIEHTPPSHRFGSAL